MYVWEARGGGLDRPRHLSPDVNIQVAGEDVVGKAPISRKDGVADEAEEEKKPLTLFIDKIQVICPASDFMFFFDQLKTKLDDRYECLLPAQSARWSSRTYSTINLTALTIPRMPMLFPHPIFPLHCKA